MGHKKRNPAPRSKQSPAPPPPAADGPVQAEAVSSPVPIAAREDALAESDTSSFSAIRTECERALNAVRRGNHNKALRLMKECCARYESSTHAALAHRVHGTVFVKVASIIDDLNTKQRHLRCAIDSARRAVELSPSSVEFAHFYANLLFEAAKESKEYEEVVVECERALAIENPVDPAKETLQEGSPPKQATAEERISHVQGELRNLIQKSNFASISTWMKNLGGDEKFRLIPIKRPTEDPMELRLVQARRPNEIKKATKTTEERRQEIEVRVAAAKLLQQQSEAAGSPIEGGDKGLDSSGSGPRVLSDRKKHGRKLFSATERKDTVVRSYWSSLSNEKKRQWLSIRVSDLHAHFGFLKEVLAGKVISEAVEHAAANKTWRFWVCSRCPEEKFPDAESHLLHVQKEHLDNILPRTAAILPQHIDDKWVELIHNNSWKPIDVSAALEMLGNQQKFRDPDADGAFYAGQKTEDFEDSFRDAWDSSPKKDDVADRLSDHPTAVESNDLDRNTSCDSTGQHENHAPLAYSPPDKWPLCDDPERAKLLGKIHTTLEALIGHKCLSGSHLTKVIEFTMEELRGITSGSQLLSQGVSQTPICMWFLGPSQLKKILKFLQELSYSCGLGRYPEKSTGAMNDGNIANHGREIDEKIILDLDESSIILDETLLPTECTPSLTNKSTAHDVVGPNSNKSGSDNDVLLAWMYSDPSSRTEQLESWMRRREEKAKQHLEIFVLMEKELFSLRTLCDRKYELVGYGEALHVLEELCVEDGKRRESGDEMAQGSYEAVLRKRKEHVKGDEHDDARSSDRYEAEAAKNVLTEARTMSVDHFGDEDAYSSPPSHLIDLESGESHDGRAKDHLLQMNGCIEVTLQKQKDESSMEICKVDARMMRTITTLQQLESQIDAAAALDYRWILVPLIKSYMRTHLEDLAEKDAIEKSDAASKALIAELELDSGKGVRGGNDSLKHGNDKAKDKKRHKEQKKTKDSKASGVSEQHPNSPESNEPDAFVVSSDGDRPDSEIVTATDADELKKQEEELRDKMVKEAEARKLEETIEYQRRIEKEAKERHLAEQQKKLTLTQSGEAMEVFSDAMTEPPADVDDKLKQLKLSSQGSGNSQGVLAVAPIPCGSSSTLDTQKPGSTDHAEVKKGMSNSGSPQDSTIYSDRRTGRRARRQKSSTKLTEDKFGKENAGAGSLEGPSHDNTRDDFNPLLEDLATKTLKAEEDYEERFQADMMKAVRQSLDTSAVRRTQVGSNDVGFTPSDPAPASADKSDALGAGLQNEVGEYNCFLNVIIQSLWHLRRFRNEFLERSSSEHVHVGDPCVICALYEVFHALDLATAGPRKEAVAPTSLRIALSNLYPDSSFFQKGQMNDASEVLSVIFDCLHQSFMKPSIVSDDKSVESSDVVGVGTWDCKDSKTCLVHSLFGMDIFERMNCSCCGLESRNLKYTSFFHNINANALRTTKVMSEESSFDNLLDLVERNHQLACDPENGGCGKLNYIHHFLSSPPHVFTTVLGWQKTRETANDIAATLAALSSEIDMSVLYRGLNAKHVHSLVSVVCYYGQHYHCFAYSHELDRWIMYDDTNVKVIGSWTDILAMCERGQLQPQVLFFEAVK